MKQRLKLLLLLTSLLQKHLLQMQLQRMRRWLLPTAPRLLQMRPRLLKVAMPPSQLLLSNIER